MDLELATSEELLAELFKRHSFAGLLIHSRNTYKGEPPEKLDLSIMFSNGIKHCIKNDYKTLTAHILRHCANSVENYET